ncbi:hypothetical protein [Macrococcus equipercicus]|uniref:Uncharacterized protein n=1 Tax=Macrococcus equipercicus TaxID=69967 RepID=A0A9Q9BU57_9STAP|nr:hypothetical protein [Macrococcus equipercicus]UTH12938.1 hypothetical protein KFV11_06545 [Macrococcus equipercicus]
MRSFKSHEGMMFPFALILLMIVIFYVSSYSVRYMIKLNSIDNIEDYYYNRIIQELKEH